MVTAGGGPRAWARGTSSWRMRMAGLIPMSSGVGGIIRLCGVSLGMVRAWTTRIGSSRQYTSTNLARMTEWLRGGTDSEPEISVAERWMRRLMV